MDINKPTNYYTKLPKELKQVWHNPNYKKHLIYSWNNTELEIINKINHMSLHLFKEVKKEIIVESDDIPSSSNEEEREKKNKIDGLNYINEFIPKVSLCPRSYDNYEYQEEYKIIDN